MELSSEQLALLTALRNQGRVYPGPLTPELRKMEAAGLVASTLVNDTEFVVGISARGREVLDEASEGEVNIDKLIDGRADIGAGREKLAR